MLVEYLDWEQGQNNGVGIERGPAEQERNFDARCIFEIRK